MKHSKRLEIYNDITQIESYLLDALKYRISIVLKTEIVRYINGIKELKKEWKIDKIKERSKACH